jgi:formamidopyrimidine-DNA glycosylase
MPELPDLEYVVGVLAERLPGRRVSTVAIGNPVVLRVTVRGDPAEALRGQRVKEVCRRGHFVCLRFEKVALVVNPMLAGRFRWLDPGASRKGRPCVRLTLDDGALLEYWDEKRMGKVYLVRDGDWAAVPGFREIGVEVLSAAFTPERFAALVDGRREQVRVFLMDKNALAAIGNAYADEILFAAGLHPKTPVSRLRPEERARLYDAIRTVLREAVREVARRRPPLDEKVRDFLKVRGRKGEPCPRCGARIRSVGVRDFDAFFCPECQPATRPQFIEWRKAPTRR